MLVWIDLETTGLNPFDDHILELGIIVTTEDLVELGRWSAVLHAGPDEQQQALPEVMDMHSASGLWRECELADRRSARTLREATQWLEDWRLHHPGESWHLAGLSVWFDRAFLAAHWPDLNAGLHHRMLDVSALRLAAQCWGLPALERAPSAHRAIPDLEAAIDELRHWRAAFATLPMVKP